MRINKARLRHFFSRPLVMTAVGIGLILTIGNWLYLFSLIGPQDRPIFLHYNIYFGVDLIGPWYHIFIMPAVSSLVYLLNILFSYILYVRNRWFSYTILGITVLIQGIIWFASFLIARQNI